MIVYYKKVNLVSDILLAHTRLKKICKFNNIKKKQKNRHI